MKHKETVNLFRVFSIAVMIFVTFVVTAVICVKSRIFSDEWICILFLDIIFLLIFIFEIEYERKRNRIAYNGQTNYVRLAIVYSVSCLFALVMTFLPEFFRPVMLIPILMCAVSNEVTGMALGMFLIILMAFATGEGFYVFASYGIMTLLGAVLSQALREKRFRIFVAFLIFFLNILIPGIFFYLAYKEYTNAFLLYGACNGILTALVSYFLFGWLQTGAETEKDDFLFDIVLDDYSEVKALKDFSMAEYRHASEAAEIAFRCAKAVGMDASLCLAAGFYYRMGQWLGEPCVQNAVDKALSLCFPVELVAILAEYYGKEHLPSTPESALIHMVDALLLKFEAMEKDVGESIWNRDIIIYQTLNEFSASGLYDQSGMSMNQFLKVREFLVKEEMLN